MLKHAAGIELDILTPKPSGKAIQPNAVDITCDHVECQDSYEGAFLALDKFHAYTKFRPLEPIDLDADASYFQLSNVGCNHYRFESNTSVYIPEGYCGWLIGRSSLNRNGILIASGLYDSGYNGTVGGAIYMFNQGGLKIQKGARIAQLVIAEAETLHLYDGQYNTKK